MQTATIPVCPLEVTGKNQREKIKCITDKLEEGVKAIFTSGKFKEYLAFLSKFHHYSFNNVILISLQKPDASLVAGYGDWLKKHHRYVKKGEKAIRILAPTPYKKTIGIDVVDQDGNTRKEEKEVLVPMFKIVNVFDVSQTEGEPLPSLGVNELTGDVEQFKVFMAALKTVSPAPISYEDISDGSHGYYHHVDRRIAIQEGMSELQTLKTAIHEIAHAILHAWPENGKKPKDGPDRHTKEVQAEAVAYTICQHYGLDTAEYSFAYVAGWSTNRDTKELKASLDTIRQTAHDLITAIDAALSGYNVESHSE